MYDSVVESRFIGVIRYLFYLFIVALYAFHECFFVVRCPNTTERHRVVRRFIGQEEGILVFCVLYILFIHTNRTIYFTCKNSKNIKDTLL